MPNRRPTMSEVAPARPRICQDMKGEKGVISEIRNARA